MLKKLTEAIVGLTHALCMLRESNGLDRIERKLDTIMSKISEFATAQNTFNDRLDVAVTGLQGDVQSLKEKIEELQNSAGEITPEDQALLDELQARSEGIAAKLEALDALTPPKVPTVLA